MLETSSPPKTFLGVRFVLLGFDPINGHKDKVRSKLVECGGVDVGHYSANSNCTHVIVDNIVYDDPICVATRNDAKTLVTALWVHHSFDVGMPVDATSVLYRPLKDLNGIPGAKSLIVCLTGYQRQDRDDIMTMVNLMGAQFSKPLVANKVTHLICYRFEGEKYELAKKIPRIKLVNHRWLEDCLRDWALLPEDNYSKSGYELEMLEAEARDSEDEAEDTVVKQHGVRSMNKSPHNIKAGSPSTLELPKSEGEVPTVPLNFAMGNLSIPGNVNKLDQALIFPDMYVSMGRSSQVACKFSNAAHGELNDQHHRTPDFMVGGDLTSNSGTTKSPSHSDEKLSNSRQTPWKSTLPQYVGDKSSNGSGTSKVPFRKLNVNDDFASKSFKMELQNDKIDTDFVEALLEGSDLDNGGESSRILPQKRTMDLSYGSAKSPKMSHDAKSSIMGSLSSDKTPKVKAQSLIDGSCETSSHYMVSSDGHSPAKTANFNAVENSSVGVSPTKSSTRKSLKCDLPFTAALISESGQNGNANKKTTVTTFQRLGKSAFSSKPGIVDCVMEKSTITVSETVEPQIQHQDVVCSSPSNKEAVTNNSNNLDNLNFLKGENNDLVAKPVRKKMLAQKTLGSRSKLSSANQKGSVYLDEGASLNDATVHLNARDHEKSPSVIKPDVPLPDVNVKELKGVEGKDGATSRDVAEDKMESMDEETEASEEEDEYKLENVQDEEKAIGVQSTSKADTFMEEKSKGVHHVLSHSESCVHGDAEASVESTKGNERGKTLSDNISLLVESTSKGDGVKGKNKKGKRHPLGKTKLKTVPAENKTESVDDESEAPGEEGEHKLENVVHEVKATGDHSTSKAESFMEEKSEGVQHVFIVSEACVHGDAMTSVENIKGNEVGKTVSDKISMLVGTTSKGGGVKGKNNIGKKRPLGKTKLKTVPAENKTESMDNETKAPGEEDKYKLENVPHEAKAIGVQSTSKSEKFMEEKSEEVQHVLNHSKACVHGDAMASVENTKGNEVGKTVSNKISMLAESTSKGDGVKRKNNKGKKRPLGKTKLSVPALTDIMKPKKGICGEEIQNENLQDTEMEHEERHVCSVGKSKGRNVPKNKLGKPSEMKENRPVVCEDQNISKARQQAGKSPVKSNTTPMKINQNSAKFTPNSSIPDGKAPNKVRTPPAWFILSGHRFQRKEFQQVIKRLKGRYCRDSHHWSYQATHFIAPDPIRRTEKFFAAAASGKWILKTDYLAASNQEGRFLAEEPYEWYKNGLSEDGAINLEAPRKWRLLRERTGHGAFHGMRIIIYGECIAPPLDTLKRVVKAGDGTILATSPPYTRFLNSVVDFAIVSPGMPRVDVWVQEFLKHEIPCVAADYLVEYVCKPGYPLERHVLYNTHAWAEKSFGSLQTKAEEVVEQEFTPPDNSGSTDIPCVVCGSGDRGEVMLICGNQSGTVGCGVGTHIDCYNPPLEDVPEDDWFCPKCSQSKNSTNSSKKRKKAKSK